MSKQAIREAKKAHRAFEKLDKAAQKFKQAIAAFGEVYEPHAFGLDALVEDIDESMSELLSDINSELGSGDPDDYGDD